MDKAIAKIRGERGLSAQIARELGIHRVAVYQWERVPVNRVLQVAKIIKMRPSQIRPDIYPPRSR